MTEEEANNLIEEVNAEIETAIREWGVNGASNRPGSIHQIFIRETEGVDGSGEVLPNASNLSGVVGLSAATVYELRFRDVSGAEYAVPAPSRQPRFNSTTVRFAPTDLDFIQDSSGAMRVYVNDPWATIGGINATVVSNPAALDGGRPYLTIPNNGKQYSVFKKAECSRLAYSAEFMPVPDAISAELFECDIYERSIDADWMPHTTYAYQAGTSNPAEYVGDCVILVSGTTCMGYRNVNIAAEGEPTQMALRFIVSEQPRFGFPPIFGWSTEDDFEYSNYVVEPDAVYFDRNNNVPLVGFTNQPSFGSYPCP